VTAMTTRALGATRAELPRATGPTGADTRGKRSPGKHRPLPGRWTVGIEWTVYAVVVVVMPADCSAGEEDNRHHEHGACDDHHPRRGLIEARVRHGGQRRGSMRRRRGARRRLDRGFGCLGHASIMPRHGPAINQRHA
jgi:hypothetical protein